jgi:hypothetical protein
MIESPTIAEFWAAQTSETTKAANYIDEIFSPDPACVLRKEADFLQALQ